MKVGAGLQKDADRAGVPLRGCPHQCRLSPPLFDGVDVGTVFDQYVNGIDDADSSHRHQWGFPLTRRVVRVGASVEQHP